MLREHVMERIVVAVDGSDGSKHALAWAAKEAELRGATLDAVLVISLYTYGWTPFPLAMEPLQMSADAIRDEAAQRLDESIASVFGANDHAVDVNRVILEGPAAERLLEAAKDADLLVTGSRGYGGFRGLLLGSVSHQLVTHAPCPIVVVPSAPELSTD
jgi:nucleotide-binding universal stress UspA family protein